MITIKTGTGKTDKFVIEGPKGDAYESIYVDYYFLNGPNIKPGSTEWNTKYSLETALEFCATGRIVGKAQT